MQEGGGKALIGTPCALEKGWNKNIVCGGRGGRYIVMIHDMTLFLEGSSVLYLNTNDFLWSGGSDVYLSPIGLWTED